MDNDVVAACFAVNPNKQNFYEKTAAEFIEQISGVENFKILPNNAKVVARGAVMPKKEFKKQGGYGNAKTIDFEWDYGGIRFYASHKYTKEEGGAQGNQYKDLQNFIEEARDTALKDTCFIAIADGPFYERQDGQAGIPRIERLKQIASSKVRVCAICDLEREIKAAVSP